ncbi:MAG: outer membrane beta-barrel protein [Candidatus Aminicenantes bacterium]|nr:outer membrane beta-barrel protein [Candidatus Aminicenantes bacterium]
MKKSYPFIICFLLLPVAVYAIDFSFGFQAGLRTVSDSAIKDVYGNGQCYFPYAAINVFKGFTIGAGYEFGYSRSGTIGLYEEATTLKVTGVQAFVGYQLSVSMVTPYVFVGFGSFSYTQTVESEAAQTVDATKSTFFVAGGIKIYPMKNVYISAEVKYVPLKVKPIDDEVDLGGLRLMGGLGFTFGY